MGKLTEKQRRWIDHYVETGNAAEAARLAGYAASSDKAFGNIGSENLDKLGKYVQERIESKDDQRIAKGDEVLRFLTSVLRGEETDEVIFTGENADGGAEVQRVEKRVLTKDRLKAAEMLAKRYGLLTEKVDVTMNETGVVLLPDAEAAE